MKLTISDDASKWVFAEELGLQKGDGLKFFGKGYGTSTIQPGFSLGSLLILILIVLLRKQKKMVLNIMLIMEMRGIFLVMI